jgi:hypothetical protein
MANYDLSLFLNGTGFVSKDQRKGVPKNRCGLLKAGPMFLMVARHFIVVPFKLSIYPTTRCISHLLRLP